MPYTNFYYSDYSASATNNFIAELYKNFQQRMQWISSNPYGTYKPLPIQVQLFNFCNIDSCKNWAYTERFKYPTLPERKIPSTTIKAPNINFAKFGFNKTPALKEDGFLDGVKTVARNINCDYKDLLAVMNAECGLNHNKPNKYSGAVGLIQFMPKTAKLLGTSTEELSKMSATDQLVYVEKFLKNCKETYGFSNDKKLSGADLYSLVFLPARAKRNTLCTAGETNKNGKLLRYYEGNKGMDLNKDGKITKAEISARVDKFRVQDIGLA